MKKIQFLHRIAGRQYSIKLEVYLWDLLKVKISAEPARQYIKKCMHKAVEKDQPLTAAVRGLVIHKIARHEDGEGEALAAAMREPAVASNEARRAAGRTRKPNSRPYQQSEDE